MKSVLLLCAATAVLLTGCSKAEQRLASQAEPSFDMAAAPAPPAANAVASAESAGKAAPQPTSIPVSVPMLAYSYDYGIETPPDAVRALIKTHEAACTAAGAAVCQMVGQSVNSEGKDRLSGELSLRATPAWLATFRAGLDGQAKAAGGRLVSSSTQSEDLSRQIVDTEAAVRAKTTLRDRLQSILASRPGKLSELLEVEQALANVQQEIDATQSALAVMRTRVATSALTVHYSSQGVLAADGVWSPLGRAFSDVLGILVGTVAAMVRIAAFALPWILVVGGGLWLFRKKITWPRRRRRSAPPAD